MIRILFILILFSCNTGKIDKEKVISNLSEENVCEIFSNRFTSPLSEDSLCLNYILNRGGSIIDREFYDSKYSSGNDTIFTIKIDNSEFEIYKGDKEFLITCTINDDIIFFGGDLHVGMTVVELDSLISNLSVLDCTKLILIDEETDAKVEISLNDNEIQSIKYEGYYE